MSGFMALGALPLPKAVTGTVRSCVKVCLDASSKVKVMGTMSPPLSGAFSCISMMW